MTDPNASYSGQYCTVRRPHCLVGPEHANKQSMGENRACPRYAHEGIRQVQRRLIKEPGTGGVSTIALSLAAKAGATVIATSSSDAKLERAKNLGASHTINYKQNHNWEEQVQDLTGGAGVDIVIDQGGAETLLQSVYSLKTGGQVSQVGFLSGEGQGDLFRLVRLLIIKKGRIV